MSAKLPDGSVVSIATTLAAAKVITGLSNANPSVAASVAHGYANGELIWLKSAWQRLNDRIFRVSGQAADLFALEGQDTLNTQRFPAGTGGGTAQKITAWTQVSQILGFTTSGGDQQFANFSYLEEDFERQLPTVTSAQSIALDIADDQTLPGYIALKAASDSRALTPIRLTLPDGALVLYNGIIALNETPTLTKGQVMAVKATISLQSRPVRY
ncbi:phage tail protein [Variovorax boronicumulans]|uniref:phage tail protein n=1 Tax=Variovorax boronicumulans TaxID=436515 RepID=UPI001C581DAA